MPTDYNDFNFKRMRGDDTKLTIKVTDPLTGNARNITGWKFWCTGKESLSHNDAQARFALETGTGITTTSAAGGVAVIAIPGTASKIFAADTMLYVDVQAMDAAGFIETPQTGKIWYYLDVTQDDI